ACMKPSSLMNSRSSGLSEMSTSKYMMPRASSQRFTALQGWQDGWVNTGGRGGILSPSRPRGPSSWRSCAWRRRRSRHDLRRFEVLVDLHLEGREADDRPSVAAEREVLLLGEDPLRAPDQVEQVCERRTPMLGRACRRGRGGLVRRVGVEHVP